LLCYFGIVVLAHLLFRTGGVDLRHDDFIRRMSGNNKHIEVFCNKFAGEFLVPSELVWQKSIALVVRLFCKNPHCLQTLFSSMHQFGRFYGTRGVDFLIDKT